MKNRYQRFQIKVYQIFKGDFTKIPLKKGGEGVVSQAYLIPAELLSFSPLSFPCFHEDKFVQHNPLVKSYRCAYN